MGIALRVLATRRMMVALVMGFSCGLPLLLTITLLQAWMKARGVDLGVIGLMSLVGLPYTLKFLWAPAMDRYSLSRLLGRRRSWLLASQLGLTAAIVALAHAEPAAHPWLTAALALGVSFSSASQDIVVDAYRREDVPTPELGLASSLYVNGYRLGMLLAGGGGLILAQHIGFKGAYLVMAACMLPGIITTLLTPEPPPTGGQPTTLAEAVVAPLKDFFSRPGAIEILAFILLYKIGDSMASTMTTPFYMETGYTLAQIGTVVKLFGFWATMAGTLIGGALMLRLGMMRSLWGFGVLQGLSTAAFALLTLTGPSLAWLAGVVSFENITSGMGTAAFMAYMAALTNRRFTATQYALLTSLMGIPRVVASAPTGWMAEAMGWGWFFVFCALMAIPGLWLLVRLPAPES